jgi:G3E family GTPase
MAEITPITLLIGLPGAGKTTLLAHLRQAPEMAGVAVVAAQPDPPMWWNAGCPCCAPRDDVARALRTLLPTVRRDEVRRVVIETTGLADPGPILATLLSDTVAASAYRLDAIVTVVDAVSGDAALDAQERAVRQVAVADRIVLSKTDLADAPALRARLRRLNPGALIVAAPRGLVDPAVLLGAGLFGSARDLPNVRGWLDSEAFIDTAQDDQVPAQPPGEELQSTRPRDTSIHAFCLTFDGPLPWPDVTAWLERLILTHGDGLLRLKGILLVQGQNAPVAVHSMGHLLHPPIPLASWPDGDPRNSRLTFITRDLPRATVAAGLPAFASICAS